MALHVSWLVSMQDDTVFNITTPAAAKMPGSRSAMHLDFRNQLPHSVLDTDRPKAVLRGAGGPPGGGGAAQHCLSYCHSLAAVLLKLQQEGLQLLSSDF